jgi:hypothetical protein
MDFIELYNSKLEFNDYTAKRDDKLDDNHTQSNGFLIGRHIPNA